ncbi:unnamed protein product [Schistocephalus solidus]|uniref:Transposase n=1 Tax=Schistocephalus solidus TaxID=70667 RepID=A0A183T7T6_SCHSO|nr:unnamed protein product [Schistocephalus solidus]
MQKKVAWMHLRLRRWQPLDYVLFQSRDRQDVLVTKAIRDAEGWTDHRLPTRPSGAGTARGKSIWLPTTPWNNRNDFRRSPATREIPGDANPPLRYLQDLTKAFYTVNGDEL